MKKPNEILKAYASKLFSDLHSAIIGSIVAAVLLSLGGIYIFSKTLWTHISTFLQTPTPLWVLILCIFVALILIIISTKRKQKSLYKKNYVIKYISVNGYKWEVKVYKDGYFEVDKYPYCVEHDLKFIFGRDSKYCPGLENQKCSNCIDDRDHFKIYESAKSIIENKVRNKRL